MCDRNGDRVFAFGVGDDCDKELIENSADAGKGNSYFVSDNNLADLRSYVIDALQKSSEPLLKNCSLDFNYNNQSNSDLNIDEKLNIFTNYKYNLGNIFRNQLI